MKREELTKKMRWDIAEKLAAERLPYVNSITKPVHQKKVFTEMLLSGFLTY